MADLADVLNPLRNGLDLLDSAPLITHYDVFLRNESIGEELAPTATLHIGTMPTSKVLRAYLKSVAPIQFLLGNGFKKHRSFERAFYFIDCKYRWIGTLYRALRKRR